MSNANSSPESGPQFDYGTANMANNLAAVEKMISLGNRIDALYLYGDDFDFQGKRSVMSTAKEPSPTLIVTREGLRGVADRIHSELGLFTLANSEMNIVPVPKATELEKTD